METQGWHPDPYGRHDDRWFSAGEPTRLVRDQGTESNDEPPRGHLAPAPVARDKPRQEQLTLTPYPHGAAAGQERAPRGHWHWWTVLVLGLLVLALSGFIAIVAAVGSAMACMDTCIPSAQARASTVLTVSGLIFITSCFLLVAGLVVPAWRRYIASAFSAALVLAIGFAVFAALHH